MFIFDRDYIKQKLEELRRRDERKVNKAKLGQVAGSEAKHTSGFVSSYDWIVEGKYIDRYFTGLKRIAKYYGVPVSIFFGIAEPKKPIDQIADELRKMGFDEKYIRAQIEQIKIMAEEDPKKKKKQ